MWGKKVRLQENYVVVNATNHGSLEWDEAIGGGISRLQLRFLTMSLSFSLYGLPRITTSWLHFPVHIPHPHPHIPNLILEKALHNNGGDFWWRMRAELGDGTWWSKQDWITQRERERGGWQHSKQNGYSFFQFQLLKYFKFIN